MSKKKILFLTLFSLQLVVLFSQNPTTETKRTGFNKDMVPEPVLTNDHQFIELYYKAWDLAYAHIRTDSGVIQSPYVDEAFDPATIWIWDTDFMVQFCKYSPGIFPGIESLNNFYAPVLDSATISLRIEIPDNPPLFSWTEYEYNKLTNDQNHLNQLMNVNQYPQRYFEWFETAKPGMEIARSAPTYINKVALGYHWEGGRSGMDNSPRGRITPRALRARPNNPKMLWIDAIAQQGLSALYISRLYGKMGNKELEKKWKTKYNELKSTVNKYYWEEADKFYYDIDEQTLKPIKVQTMASYWVMLAEMCSPEQARAMVAHIMDPNVFGGVVPLTSLARNDADFSNKGGYWRGSVWLPTAYMAIKALQKYNYHELSYQCAYDIISHMEKTYLNYSPNTIWECYNPNLPEPAFNEFNKRFRPDFCGWSALGPISLLIENVLGFYDIDAKARTIKWHKTRTDEHGIKNLRFGSITTDIIAKKQSLFIKSNADYTLIMNGKKFKIKSGEQENKI